MGGKPTAAQVLALFQAIPEGHSITRDELVAKTGLGADQVLAAVNNLRVRHQEPIEVVQRGQIWKYRPHTNHVHKGQMFEAIGASRNGVIIVQDEEGNLYRLKEIE